MRLPIPKPTSASTEDKFWRTRTCPSTVSLRGRHRHHLECGRTPLTKSILILPLEICLLYQERTSHYLLNAGRLRRRTNFFEDLNSPRMRLSQRLEYVWLAAGNSRPAIGGQPTLRLPIPRLWLASSPTNPSVPIPSRDGVGVFQACFLKAREHPPCPLRDSGAIPRGRMGYTQRLVHGDVRRPNLHS